MDLMRLVTVLAALVIAWPAGAVPFEEARHLLARTGFGIAGAADIAALHRLDYEAAVDRALAGVRAEPVTAPPSWIDETPPTASDRKALTAAQRRDFNKVMRARWEPLKQLWAGEMLATPSPLTEHLVLFWHNHFVSEIKTALKGFDTHAGQSVDHPALLTSLANGLAAFVRSVEAKGHWDRVLVMTYSEFGRRPKENDSDGTDHGTSAPHFLIGGRVRGGFYGEQPPLDDLVERNLAHRLHFRSLYATVAREWWGLKADFIKEKGLGCIV